MKLDLVLDKGFFRLATLLVLMVGLLTTSITAMREWSQQQELANFQLLSQRYAALAEEMLVQVEAELQRSSASKALPKNSDLLQERLGCCMCKNATANRVLFLKAPLLQEAQILRCWP